MLLFYLIMNDLWRGCFPSREGIKGCVMVRGAGCDEMFLLLFGDVVFLGFGWMLLILGSCARTSHTPAPLERGDFECCVFVGNERFDGVSDSPLERG